MLVRGGPQARHFPPVADLVGGMGEGTPDPFLSNPVLALAATPLKGRKLYAGRGLSGSEHIARLLQHWRLAMRAEQDARRSEADFYWSILDEELPSLADPAVAEALAAVAPEGDGVVRIVDEILIDGHLAWVNGAGDDAERTTAARAIEHLQRIVETLPQTGLAGEDLTAFVDGLAAAAARLGSQGKMADAAIGICEALKRLRPASLAVSQALADSIVYDALQGIEALPDDQAAARIEAQLDRLEAAEREFPDAALCGAVAFLCRVGAIRMANADRLASGLVLGRKAQFYGPGSEADELMGQLIDAMSARIEQSRALQEDVRKTGGRLNDKGAAFVKDANAGFKRLETFDGSSAPAAIAEGRRAALDVRFWRLVKQAEPVDREAATALARVVNTTDDPGGPSEAWAEAFRAAAAVEPKLTAIGWEAVARFLRGERQDPAQGEAAEPSAPPVLALPPRAANSDEPPWRYVLYGRKGAGLRLLGAVAAILVVATLGLGGYEWFQSRTRDMAFARLLDADRRGDDRAALSAAGEFLSARLLVRSDGRIPRVNEIRRDALEAPNRRIRDAAYSALIEADREGDDEQVLDQGARFLEAPPIAVADDRTEQVHRLFDEHFLFWLPITRDLPESRTRPMIARYQALAGRAAPQED